MQENCAYESPEMTKLLGATLRPGGFALTDQGIDACRWKADQLVLDLGCGQGATVRYLKDKHGIRSVGIDPSEKLIGIARETGCKEEFHVARGESIPFENERFHGVISECTLSLMDEISVVLKEVHRVLKRGGYLFITDVYARKPEMVDVLKKESIRSCMRGLYGLDEIKQQLLKMGFEVIRTADYSELLSQLMVKIIFEHGSMDAFWKKTGGPCVNHFQEALKKCKSGYYMLIARKAE